MKNSLLTFVLCTIVTITMSAQPNDTICIDGRVLGPDGMAVEMLILTAMHPTDSSVIAYCMTDGDGHYCLRMGTELQEVLVQVSGFNVKREIRRLSVKKQTLDFKVQEENIALHLCCSRLRKNLIW